MKTIKLSSEIEILAGLVAAIQGVYLSTVSILSRKKSISGILLSIVFISVTLRIIKSLLWVYFEHVDLWILNLGFLSHSIYGPALFLYFYHDFFQKKWRAVYFFHFVPSLFLFLTISTLTLEDFWYSFGYSTLLIHQGIYAVATCLLFYVGLRNRQLLDGMGRQRFYWYLLLLSGALLLQLAYFSNYMLGLTPYLLGPIIYAVFLFATSIFIFMNPGVLHGYKGKQQTTLSNEESMELKMKLLEHMEILQPFLNPNCTLTSLSRALGTQPYKLSYLINKEFNQNFSSFLNSYRIKNSMQFLQDERSNQLKIAAIAFDCGFNSISSFNQAFKREVGMTPSQYREKNQLTDL